MLPLVMVENFISHWWKTDEMELTSVSEVTEYLGFQRTIQQLSGIVC